jgi:transcriptional regulator of NAD metabolism
MKIKFTTSKQVIISDICSLEAKQKLIKKNIVQMDILQRESKLISSKKRYSGNDTAQQKIIENYAAYHKLSDETTKLMKEVARELKSITHKFSKSL